MDVLEEFLQQIGSCFRLPQKDQPLRLAYILSPNPRVSQYVVKINSLGLLNQNQIVATIERLRWHNEEWPAFEIAVKSFITLCNQINPWSLLESFDLYSTYLHDICVAFSNKSRGHLLTLLFKDVVEILIPMARQLDEKMLLKELRLNFRLTYVAAVVLKGFNHVRSLLGANDYIEDTKNSIMLFLGGRLCLIYFRISNPLLCQNVFSNMNNANLHISAFPRNEQVFYRYFLAKFYMVRYQFVDAFQHLTWCLRNIPLKYHKNVTLILRDLLPLSIILGKRPLLQEFQRKFYSTEAELPSFFALYCDLLSAIKSGSFYQLHQVLNQESNLKFLKKTGLDLIVASKSFILTMRNLLRLVWVAGGKVSKLTYDEVGIALRMSLNGLDISALTTLASSNQGSFPDEDFDYIIENCLVTLIDQNLLKGKVIPRLRVVTLAKTDAFPSVDTIYFANFGNGPEGTLAYADRWMA